MLRGALITFPMLGLGIACATMPGKLGYACMFIVGGLFFLSLLLLEVVKLIRSDPILLVRQDGVYLRDYNLLLPYETLQNAAARTTLQNNTILAINPRDAGGALRRASFAGRVTASFNRSAHLPPICIGAKGLTPSAKTIAIEINERIKSLPPGAQIALGSRETREWPPSRRLPGRRSRLVLDDLPAINRYVLGFVAFFTATAYMALVVAPLILKQPTLGLKDVLGLAVLVGGSLFMAGGGLLNLSDARREWLEEKE